ncbi:MAG TPA: ABC-2 family transporter protein [Chloroflexota bacterium]|nr:ABC-2 family transporter protein [Chloroflexota bacterium]
MAASVAGAHRLVRRWLFFGRLDALWMIRDLGSFAGYAFSEGLKVLAAIATMLLLSERFDGVGPWTQPQVVFLLGFAVTANGMIDDLFGYNVAYISRRIGRGQLDHVLMQPQPMPLTLLTEGFSPAAGLPVLGTGLLLLAWGIGGTAAPASPLWFALLALNLGASCVVILAFAYAVGSLAFWAPRAAEEINSSSWSLITQLRAFPLDGVRPALLGGLLSVVPAGFAAWYPCRALLGLDHWRPSVVVTPLAAVAFALVALWIFRTGMAHYLDTGSQRYLSYGHRR